ncbi:MAG: hypothetical protein ACTHJR_18120 [Sphingomonas sp.]|uniref:hypothetical protein n=1 Tax=Sphingomonas sp. TaxID=28214 RepID=UPI003F7DA677
MKHIFHVAQDAIKANVKDGGDRPAVIDRTYKGGRRVHELGITDAEGNIVARIIQRTDKPLSCGARVWIESQHEPVVIRE